ncbi:type I-E CRISPR-associated protein Cse2/CasB [Ectothiorhodospira variabilis]|uniref:type I-E CRISPR-associated protein Cse2/CasB n=1 Tax=Ectothiorhodospira variabilis TaxID=505694 RepID=UPI001EFB4A3D|nr:type I-E CRISPR-associated protein Cse2/CasB [Ectothiorhodospira variabilis]MCG5494362.1 type I-E CRISPR-associated protein Cse2/CasB [Ectothiorhodospira variabilis]MCG5504129.1 type I-E CRISPR-associated protein Cse2/CasB [Ectothiorhodospira variabilis]MCG5507284.1 type I-E CRISPR-associated protein Cse2/CasB [Ectothiorhodospira variabilis]
MSETELAPPAEAPPRVPERLYAIERREADALRRWWQRLTLSAEALKAHTDAPPWPKGMRAALRRCDTIEAAMLTEAFRHLWRWLPAQDEQPEHLRDQRLQVWTCIALVVAELREEQPRMPLGAGLGRQKRETGKPYMSELRFQQLMTAGTPEELVQRLRRALALIDKRGVSVAHLADNIALWWREYQGGASPQPTRRLGFVWANDYFGATAGYRQDNE